MVEQDLYITHIFLLRLGFSSVPRLSDWSFQQLIYGGVSPPPHCPDTSGPAVSPTDKLRKNSALTPVTSEKSTLFSWVTKIVRLCKGLGTSNRRKSKHNIMWRSHEKVVCLHSTFFIFHRAFCFCREDSAISNQASYTFLRTGHGQKGGFCNGSKGV